MDMQLKPINTVEGAYWYFIVLLTVLALLFALYIAGIMVGVAPDLVNLY